MFRSLGLAVAPRVRFLQKRMGEQYRKSGPKNISNELDSDNAEEEDSKELKPNPTVVKFTKSAPSFDFSVEGNFKLIDAFVYLFCLIMLVFS